MPHKRDSSVRLAVGIGIAIAFTVTALIPFADFIDVAKLIITRD